MVEPVSIFASPFAQSVLSFVLVFTIIFAVLQKSEILGKGKKQIDALVALAIGLIVISVGYALDIIQKLIPFLAVGLVIILVFLILLAAVFEQGQFKVPGWLQLVFGIIIFIAVLVVVLLITGGWDYIKNFFSGRGSVLGNIILIVVVILAVIVAWFGGGKSESGK